MVQNLDLFIRTFGRLSENYDHISIKNIKFGMSCHTPFTPNEIKFKVIKCNTSLLETCHNFNFKRNKHDTHITTKTSSLKQNKHITRILKRLLVAGRQR